MLGDSPPSLPPSMIPPILPPHPLSKILRQGQCPQIPRITKGGLPTERLSVLALNAQKAGSNIPSLANIVSIFDLHTPNFPLFTEIPLPPNNGALTRILRNKGIK